MIGTEPVVRLRDYSSVDLPVSMVETRAGSPKPDMVRKGHAAGDSRADTLGGEME